jgi:signal transduction histidine kinase/integral membrane sensor domain MASE1
MAAPARRRLSWAYVLQLGLVTTVYFVAAKVGLALSAVYGSVSLLWPPTGVALASVLLLGWQTWPAILLGAVLVNALTNGPVTFAVIAGTGNTFEALVGAYLLRRFVRFHAALDRVGDVAALVCLAAGLSTAVSATFGVLGLCLTGMAPWQAFGPTWGVWWLGDAMGDLVVAPVLLTWGTRRPWRVNPRQAIEMGLWLVAISLASWLAFNVHLSRTPTDFSLAYLAFPLLMWAALRFGTRGSSVSLLVVSGIAVWGTFNGLGLFASPAVNAPLLFLWVFMGVAAVATLFLAAAVTERKNAEGALRRSEAQVRALNTELEQRVRQRTIQLEEALQSRDAFLSTAQQARADAEKATERTARLQRITAALSEALTPSQVSHVILSQGLLAVGAAAGSIVLLGEDQRTLEVTASTGFSPEVMQAWSRFSLDVQVPLADAIRLGSPIWIESRQERETLYPNTMSNLQGYYAWAAIPMIIEKQALGGLGLAFRQAKLFSEEDRMFLVAVAQQSAQAVERARLYAESQASADVLRQRVEERTQELQEALVQAQSADRTKSTLLATVSHEMRTPLSSIVGFSNLILNRKPPPDKTLEYTGMINAEARRLATLINDFLDLQRIEAGRENFQFSQVNLVGLVEDVVGKQALGESNPRTIRLNLEATPPVYADADRIRQVLLNLLSNALKYSSGGEIMITLRASAGSVICSVQDRGLGLPQDELGRVFDRFYRGEAAERMRIRGTGLGLALCREIIQAHGGRIWAESPGPNQGSTFSFSLPIVEATSILH